MSIPVGKTRLNVTVSQDNVAWIQAWLKRHGVPRNMLSSMVDDYLQGIRGTLEELEKMEQTPTIGDLFKITGDQLNRLKEPPLL